MYKGLLKRVGGHSTPISVTTRPRERGVISSPIISRKKGRSLPVVGLFCCTYRRPRYLEKLRCIFCWDWRKTVWYIFASVTDRSQDCRLSLPMPWRCSKLNLRKSELNLEGKFSPTYKYTQDGHTLPMFTPAGATSHSTASMAPTIQSTHRKW